MTLTIQSFLFLAVVTLVFFGIKPTYRVYVLAFSSVGYVYLLNKNAAVIAIAVAVYAYLFGIVIGRLSSSGRKKPAVIASRISVCICVAVLLFLKYAHLLHMSGDIIVPIGFSFYIFQVISYLTDICSDKAEAEKNPFKLIVYLVWFPKFVSGPIERKEAFTKQLEGLRSVGVRDADRWIGAIHYMLVGLFYKLVIADRIGIFVDSIYSHYAEYDAAWLMAGTILYTLQIYFDFAGYSYAAVGASRIFGIELSENFRMPYLSANVTEFWRRWHISLSSWLRDYIYIPLGGNRRGAVRKIINTLIVFILCGMWHGDDLSFIIWGLLHGIFSAVDSVLSGKGAVRLRSGWIGRVITFVSVSFAWIFFRAENAATAVGFIVGMFTPGRWFTTLVEDRRTMNMDISDLILILFTVALALWVEILAYRRDIAVPEVIVNRHYTVRIIAAFIAVTVIMIFGVYGPDTAGRLIYMQF